MKYPAYPKYKDSGVEWLGDVPEHWGVGKLGFEASVKARLGWKGLKAEEYVDEGYVFLSTPNIKDNCIDFDNVNYITEERYFESPEIMICQGDVLIAKDGSTTGITNVVRHLPSPATVNSSLAVLRPKDGVDSVYLYYWMLSSFTQFVIKKMQGGMGVPHLFQADLKKFSLLLPSLPEQRAIAAFLDAQTSRLDTLIAKERELIDKLKEKRAALITRTVTRGLPPDAATAAGLDPNPKMKDSGVEWLGEVPEHWEVKQGRYLGSLHGSITPGEDDLAEPEGDHVLPLFAKVDDLNGLIRNFYLEATQFAVSGYNPIPPPVLLFPKRGAAIFTNKVAIAEKPILFDPNIMGMKTNKLSNIHYVAYCFVARRLDDLADVSTVPQINNKHVNPAFFPVPPLSEQRAIAAYLDRETAAIDALVAKVETSIERLQEYRAALITAAVTGQIDVREAVQ